jgi:replication-associated recombination protein RarA
MKISATTFGRYEVHEALSALQKSIRRGLEEDAIFWAHELYEVNPTLLWRRLLIIASEDIGVASPSASILVRSLYQNYLMFTAPKPNQKALDFGGDDWEQGMKDVDAARLFVIHAVIALAQAKKSRRVNHGTILAFNDGLQRRDVPEYALDKHTLRGATMNRGVEHFFRDGAHLENSIGDDPYEERARALFLEKEKVKIPRAY